MVQTSKIGYLSCKCLYINYGLKKNADFNFKIIQVFIHRTIIQPNSVYPFNFSVSFSLFSVCLFFFSFFCPFPFYMFPFFTSIKWLLFCSFSSANPFFITSVDTQKKKKIDFLSINMVNEVFHTCDLFIFLVLQFKRN